MHFDPAFPAWLGVVVDCVNEMLIGVVEEQAVDDVKVLYDELSVID